METGKALLCGAAGAALLTIVHESARQVISDAPRMDLLGMRAIAKGFNAAGEKAPAENHLYTMAMAGDLVSNSLYYSLVAASPNKWLAGAALGLAAGIGGVVLPGPLGLGSDASARTTQTKIMTAAWYLLGGLATAAVAQAVSGNKKTT